MAGKFVAIPVQPAQPLAHVLGAGHQIAPVEAKTGPVLEHPQALPGPVQVGVEQTIPGGTVKAV